MSHEKFSIRRIRTISDSESTELPDTVRTYVPKSNFGSDDISFKLALFLCFLWCSISVVNNIISKTLLNNFSYPLSSTLCQLFLTAVHGHVVVIMFGIPNCDWKKISNKYILRIILPLGLGKLLAACGTHISVSKLPVSYAHTIKASMPIFVVLFSIFLYNESYSYKVYLSLTVIFSGIALATITELSFNLIGLLSAVAATAAFALLNILTKRCLNATHMHQFRLLLILARISTLFFLPIWFYNDGLTFIYTDKRISKFSLWKTLLLLISDGSLNFTQNLIAFTLMAKITPLSYAVCNIVKRISVIVGSIFIFSNPVTLLNMTGMFMSVVGVFLYNMVRSKVKKSGYLPIHHGKGANGFIPNQSGGLPYIMSEGNLENYNGNHIINQEHNNQNEAVERRIPNVIDIV